jgi:hypothetical protein
MQFTGTRIQGCRPSDLQAAPGQQNAKATATTRSEMDSIPGRPVSPGFHTDYSMVDLQLPASVHLCTLCARDFVNDPSAGSPTETLLRLLLPLDDQV